MSDLGTDMNVMSRIHGDLEEAASQVRDAIKLLRKACKAAEDGHHGMMIRPTTINRILKQVGYRLARNSDYSYDITKCTAADFDD